MVVHIYAIFLRFRIKNHKILSCDTDVASDGSLLESFNTLSKGLRNLRDVPLGISSVDKVKNYS